MPLRGEVWFVNLNPTQGYQQAKTRPCVVISNNLMNTKMGLSIVVPFTGSPFYTQSGKLSPALIQVVPPDGGISKDSYSMAFQVRTVAHNRFIKKVGDLSDGKLHAIVASVQEIIE
jgi:mRNA interferase MazF